MGLADGIKEQNTWNVCWKSQNFTEVPSPLTEQHLQEAAACSPRSARHCLRPSRNWQCGSAPWKASLSSRQLPWRSSLPASRSNRPRQQFKISMYGLQVPQAIDPHPASEDCLSSLGSLLLPPPFSPLSSFLSPFAPDLSRFYRVPLISLYSPALFPTARFATTRFAT